MIHSPCTAGRGARGKKRALEVSAPRRMSPALFPLSRCHGADRLLSFSGGTASDAASWILSGISRAFLQLLDFFGNKVSGSKTPGKIGFMGPKTLFPKKSIDAGD